MDDISHRGSRFPCDQAAARRLAILLTGLVFGLATDVAAAEAKGKPAATTTSQTGVKPASTKSTADPNGEVAAAGNNAVLINLIRLLVQEGVITPEKAQRLLSEAQAEAAAPVATPPAAVVAPVPLPSAGSSSDVVRVPYIPEPVRRQITEQVKQDVLTQAKNENWAAPNEVPSWVHRFKPYGDLRLRYEHDAFGPKNPQNGFNRNAVDFNAINTGPPIDLTSQNPPLYNTDEDRDRFQLRARLGVTAEVDDWIKADVRVATGNDNGPVSTNQTLGNAPTSGQGSEFSKYNIWLDQAYLEMTPTEGVVVDVGRAPNPFFHTDLIWDNDVNFDGISVQGSYPVRPNIHPFVTLGAFPVYNTNFNFSTYDTNKESSRDRYLFGTQVGVDTQPRKDLDVKAGVAYYYFLNMEGDRSNPCLVLNSSTQCDSDNSRPQFAQKGNTYYALRDIIPTTANGNGTTNQFQYFGLATPFHELALTTQADLSRYDPIHVIFDGEFVKNLAFNKSSIDRKVPENNLDNGDNFDGGDMGFLTRVTVGHPDVDELWDWNVSLAYKYLESDAVVDGLTDSDFNLGGTNAQGFILGGRLGIAHKTYLQAKWMSSQQISGENLDIDVIQVELNAKF